jgi:hypothetical protein
LLADLYLFVYAQVREGMREEYGCRGNKEERGRERRRIRNVNRLDKSVRWKSETAQLDRASDQRIFACSVVVVMERSVVVVMVVWWW